LVDVQSDDSYRRYVASRNRAVFARHNAINAAVLGGNLSAESDEEERFYAAEIRLRLEAGRDPLEIVGVEDCVPSSFDNGYCGHFPNVETEHQRRRRLDAQRRKHVAAKAQAEHEAEVHSARRAKEEAATREWEAFAAQKRAYREAQGQRERVAPAAVEPLTRTALVKYAPREYFIPAGMRIICPSLHESVALKSAIVSSFECPRCGDLRVHPIDGSPFLRALPRP